MGVWPQVWQWGLDTGIPGTMGHLWQLWVAWWQWRWKICPSCNGLIDEAIFHKGSTARLSMETGRHGAYLNALIGSKRIYMMQPTGFHEGPKNRFCRSITKTIAYRGHATLARGHPHPHLCPSLQSPDLPLYSTADSDPLKHRYHTSRSSCSCPSSSTNALNIFIYRPRVAQ